MKATVLSSLLKFGKRRRAALSGQEATGPFYRKQSARKTQNYYYLRYAIAVLRVLPWVVLVLGFVASLVLGITAGGFEGMFRILIGAIGSFLAWLFLLTARELLKLFVDIKEHTRRAAERAAIRDKPQ